MSTQTPFLGLTKPNANEYFNLSTWNTNLDKIDEMLVPTYRNDTIQGYIASGRTNPRAINIVGGYCRIGMLIYVNMGFTVNDVSFTANDYWNALAAGSLPSPALGAAALNGTVYTAGDGDKMKGPINVTVNSEGRVLVHTAGNALAIGTKVWINGWYDINYSYELM